MTIALKTFADKGGQIVNAADLDTNFAQIVGALGTDGIGMSAAAIQALTQAEPGPATTALLPGVDAAGVLAKFPLAMFASRRTQDLQPVTLGLYDDIMQIYRPGEDLSYAIDMGAFSRLCTGFINAALPPYNCVADGMYCKTGSITAGSNVVTTSIGDAPFIASDVGKLIWVSNVGVSAYSLAARIKSVVSANQCTLGTVANPNVPQNATLSGTNLSVLWGTSNTIGAQAALNAAASQGTYTYGQMVYFPPGRGGYISGPLRYPARMGVWQAGNRLGPLIRQPYSGMDNFFANADKYVDFPVLINIAIHGAKYNQSYDESVSIAFSYIGAEGTDTLPQTDPYPLIVNPTVWDSQWDGVYLYGRNAGRIIGVESTTNQRIGLNIQCYDADISLSHVEGNQATGTVVGGANNNVTANKNSFNGGAGGSDATFAANMHIQGVANRISNTRNQESWGSDTVITGNQNSVLGHSVDDAGDQAPVFGISVDTLPPVRAMILLQGSSCVDNRFAEVMGGHDIRDQDYATHALFVSNEDGEPTYNSGTIMLNRSPGAVFTPYVGNGGTIPEGTGDYAPNVTGTDCPDPIGTTNHVEINWTLVP